MVGIVTKTTFLTCPASNGAAGNVTSPWAMGNTRRLGVIVPAVTSCALFLQVAADAASASFARATVQSGQLQYAVAAGPAGIDLGDAARGFPYARIELSAQQASVRSLSIIQRT
jgi:uncharacterized membrane-anchored protein